MNETKRDEVLEAELQASAMAAAIAQARQDAALAAEGREARLQYQREYAKRGDRRAYQREYTKRDEVKARRREYHRTPEVKEARNAKLRAQRAENRAAKLRTPSPHTLRMDECSSEGVAERGPAKWGGFVVG